MRDIRLLLDNIRSVHNVGSIFRTAETLGISKIYCLDTTPTPVDRFGRKRKDFGKVSLGAEDMVAWEHVSDPQPLLRQFKKEGFEIMALEQTGDSVDYRKVQAKQKMLVILGNEVEGISPELLGSADIKAEIPLAGKKESLNVSVASAVFLYRLLDNI